MQHVHTPGLNRRVALHGLASLTFASPVAATAKSEIDASTGNLYTPKSEMLSGGSKAARGINKASGADGGRLQPGQVLQTVYSTRFILYLSRFLLNFDPAARAWWVKQGMADTWEEMGSADTEGAFSKLAEFAESLELGLADYFVGPYGSYSSVAAAKAGMFASKPVQSVRPDDEEERRSIIARIFRGRKRISDDNVSSRSLELARNGILNLYALLKARYTSTAAKRQLAILFSLIANPKLQPCAEIRALLGEADNATVTEIEIFKSVPTTSEATSRTSPRRGGGYGAHEAAVKIETPPALGDEYRAATVEPIMRPTSRVLRIHVEDGGVGYTEPPRVTVSGMSSFDRQCRAAAILDRLGRVESVVVLDPGYGYGKKNVKTPLVFIEPPQQTRQKRSETKTLRRSAKATAELEYELVRVRVLNGGNGYSRSEPPTVTIVPPADDPDWFLNVQEQPELRMIPVEDRELVRAQVSEMKYSDGKVALSLNGMPESSVKVTRELFERIQRDPLELLPSSIRPVPSSHGQGYYVPYISSFPSSLFGQDVSPKFRSVDPLFGPLGRVPVTKAATELSASEYSRVALSGAVCTVIVRTALNPLELIKTKQQLGNDVELLEFARRRKVASQDGEADSASRNAAQSTASSKQLASLGSSKTSTVAVVAEVESAVDSSTKEEPPKEGSLGTLDVAKAIVDLRGVSALFQSADITFIASLAFGSFGFGATELFRRSFTAAFTGQSSEASAIAVLLAASLATVVTAAVASPFELLRVRSMGKVEAKQWTEVLQDSLGKTPAAGAEYDAFILRSLRPKDVAPLWAGFAPTVSRELPFAVTKFLVFDTVASKLVAFINSQAGDGALPIQVGVGFVGLGVSALSGALAGVAGAAVSHPADLILTLSSARNSSQKPKVESKDSNEGDAVWFEIVKDLVSRDGGLLNLFVGLPARSLFFFLVIGLQFFLYDYVKALLAVGSDDVTLVLDVFYAIRSGL